MAALFPAPALLFLCVSYSICKLFRQRKQRQVVDDNSGKPRLSDTDAPPVSPPSSEDTAAAFKSLSRSLSAVARSRTIAVIDSLPGLARLMDALDAAVARGEPVGVDLEHSPKSFHGFVCTVQVSTMDGTDWLIDALVPEVRSGLRNALAPSFSSPVLVKVFHAARNDVRWLASDFGVSVSCVFDTAVAARLLGCEKLALADVARRFLGGIEMDKTLQLADWRQRPLPREHVSYAVRDSSVLLELLPALLAAAADADEATWGPHRSPVAKAGFFKAVLVTSHQLAASAPLPIAHFRSAEVFDKARWTREATRRKVAALEAVIGENGTPLGALADEREERHLDFSSVFVALCGCRHEAAVARDECLEDVLSTSRIARIAALASLGGNSLDRLVALVPLDLQAAVRSTLAAAPTTPATSASAPADSDGRLLPASTQDARRQSKARRAANVFVARTTPLYSNIALMAPDDTLMACIDLRRAAWYISVGAVDTLDGDGCPVTLEDPSPAGLLALTSGGGDKISGGQLRLRLRAQPKGRGHAGDAFHLAAKRNECVVCGLSWEQATAGGAGLNRLYVMPRMFRQHLPLAAKSYTSHDVVLSCSTCHHAGDIAMSELARRVALEMGVPFSPREAQKLGFLSVATSTASSSAEQLVVTLRTIKRAATAICKAAGALPGDKLASFLNAISEHADFVNGRLLPRLLSAGQSMSRNASRWQRRKSGLVGRRAHKHGEMESRTGAPLGAVGSADSGGAEESELAPSAAAACCKAGSSAVASCADSAADDAVSPALTFDQPEALATLAGMDVLLVAQSLADEQQGSSSQAAGDSGTGSVPSRRLHLTPASAAADEWDPAMTIVQAVLVGDRLWQQAEKHYPPAEAALSDAGVGSSGLGVAAEGRVTRFVQRWRRHFLEALQPRALPDGWAVAFPVFQAGLRCQRGGSAKEANGEPLVVQAALAVTGAALESRGPNSSGRTGHGSDCDE